MLIFITSHYGQIEDYVRDGICDDAAIYDNLPINWWLENECICYLLAMLVCRDLPDVTNSPETAPPGATRIALRKRAAEEEGRETAIERYNKKVDASTAADKKFKEIQMMGMRGAAVKQRVVTMATSVGMIEKQIDLLERTKGVLVARWGQEEYDNRVAALMTKMLDDRKMSGEEMMTDGNMDAGDNDDVEE